MWGGGWWVADTNYLYPARWGWIKNLKSQEADYFHTTLYYLDLKVYGGKKYKNTLRVQEEESAEKKKFFLLIDSFICL